MVYFTKSILVGYSKSLLYSITMQRILLPFLVHLGLLSCFLLYPTSIAQQTTATTVSADDCRNSSVAVGFHLIASTKSLGKVSIGDRLLFLFARVRSGQGVCDEEVRGRGDNILQSFVSTGRKFSTGSDVLITQSIYSRVMVVGRQYGTDQNDGMIFISPTPLPCTLIHMNHL